MAKDRQAKERKAREKYVGSVRRSDIEPYTALRWVGTLFKAAAVFLAVAVLGEFIAGLRFLGTGALPELLGQLARTTVMAVVLWGGGDLVRLLIQLGNDVRAERVLLARLVHRTPPLPGEEASPVADAVEAATELRGRGDGVAA
jgi:hypothetical protein